jgi:hypothetical protein
MLRSGEASLPSFPSLLVQKFTKRGIENCIGSLYNEIEALRQITGGTLMEMTPSATFQKVSDYAQMIETVKDDPALKKAEQQIDVFKQECERLDTLIKLPREERKDKAGDLYDDIYQKYAQKQAYTSLPIALTAWMGLGTAALVAAHATAIVAPGLQSILALGFLVGTFSKRGFPTLYAKAVKKWVLPKKVDKELLETLESRSRDAHENLDSAKKTLEKLRKSNIKKAYEAQKQAEENRPRVEEIEDEPDFVMIDNMRLARQQHLCGDIQAELSPGE